MVDVGIRGGRPAQRDEPPIIELEMLPGTIASPRPAPAVHPRRGSRSRRARWRTRWWLLGVPLLVAVIVLALVVRDGGPKNPQAAPSTTVAPTTVAPATIVASSTTLASSATIAPSTTIATTTVSRPPTTVVATIALAPGPVLGAPRGWTIVSFNRATMSTVDLDTGRMVEFLANNRNEGGAESPIVLSDRVVYTSFDVFSSEHTPSVWMQRYRDEPPTLLLDRASILNPSSTPGLLWVALARANVDDEQRVAEIDLAGRVVTTLVIPNGLRVAGPSGSGLWLTGSGRMFSLARNGTLQNVAIGAAIDASVNGLLFDDCAIAGPCTLRIVSPTARQTGLGPSAELRVPTTPDSTDSPVSPNGRWLLLADGLLDRRTGAQVSHTFDLRAWRWSPDGDWLFVSTTGGATVAWNLIDGRQLPVPGIRLLSGVVAR